MLHVTLNDSPDSTGFQIVYIEEWKKNLTFKFIQYLQNYAWKNPSQYISHKFWKCKTSSFQYYWLSLSPKKVHNKCPEYIIRILRCVELICILIRLNQSSALRIARLKFKLCNQDKKDKEKMLSLGVKN